MNNTFLLKSVSLVLLGLFFHGTFGQTLSQKQLLDSSKALFKYERTLRGEEHKAFDYRPIISLLDRFLKNDSNNPEALYHLGYAYSRLNSKSAVGLNDMNVDLVIKSSQLFEKVIALSPKYTGETVILDPYGKLTAEWGSMALHYLMNEKPDSALWAFKQGRKRGGFSDFLLELSRKSLDACSKNAILMAFGDLQTFPFWYLQKVENYRTDVSVINSDLLSTETYSSYVLEQKIADFDWPSNAINGYYIPWVDSSITIGDLTWDVKSQFKGGYISISNKILLSILQKNQFQRDVFFTLGFDKSSMVSLQKRVGSLISILKLYPTGKSTLSHEDYLKKMKEVLILSKHVNLNSGDDIGNYDYLRYDVFERIQKALKTKNKKEAKALFEQLDTYGSKEKIPYWSKSYEEYDQTLRNYLYGQ